MNSDIKPDFEKLAEAHCGDMYEADAIEYICKYNGYVNACNKIWNDHVEPLLSTVKRLQEEKKELVKFIKMTDECLRDGIEIVKDDPIHKVAKDLLKSSEQLEAENKKLIDQRLQEGNEQLKESLKWALNNLNPYDKPSEQDLAAYSKATDILKQLEQ